MTPKEKAKELIEKFYKEISHGNIIEAEYEELFLYQKSAKQCALICVEEQIKNAKGNRNEYVNSQSNPVAISYFVENIKYWQEVKQEIVDL